MGVTREIYWNVGHGAATLVPMYFASLVAVALLVWGFLVRVAVYRSGQPQDRFKPLWPRIGGALVLAVSQARVLRVKRQGVVHATLFWSFALLLLGTLLILLQADVLDPLADVRLLQGPFYLGFSLVLDLAGLLALLSVLYFSGRRFLARPPGLPTRWDDYLIHGFLGAILVSGFVIEGARLAVTEVGQDPGLARWSPVGLAFAWLLGGVSDRGLLALHEGLWWLHLFLGVGLLAALPFTKLRHLVTTPVNYLFRPLEPTGYLPTPDLEAEEAESYGVENPRQFGWKHLYDADACMSCKRCQDRCPAWRSGKPLSPMQVVRQIGEGAERGSDASLIQSLTAEVIWQCTTCRSCQHACPAAIEHVNKMIELRRHLVLMEGEFPGDEVRLAMDHYEVNGNPFGQSYAARGEWAQGLEAVDLSQSPGEKVDLLYFVGCYGSFDRRNQKVAKAILRLCSAAGLTVGVLGATEKCCGDAPRKLGNEYLYQILARENIEALTDASESSGAAAVVTSCPHCYGALSRDYRDLGFGLSVEHHTTLLDRLHAEGRLDLVPHEIDCTYHDSCYLSRYGEVGAEPRRLLQAAGARLNEMSERESQTLCCGGGGGLILAEERVGRRLPEARVEMALQTGSSLLVSNCPFCLTNFEDAIKVGGAEERMEARDLAEILASRLPAPGEDADLLDTANAKGAG